MYQKIADRMIAGAGAAFAWRAAMLRQADLIRASGLCLLLVLAVMMVDACLVGLDLAFRYAVLDGTELPNWFNLSQERSLGELFEYTMTGSATLALGFTAWRARSLPLGLVAAALACITIDNSMEVHETIGEIAGPYVPGGNDVAEMLFMLVLGLIAASALLLALRKRPQALEAGGIVVTGLLMVGAVFGIFVDLLHSLAPTGTLAEVVLAGVEDGGELFSLTAAGAIAWCLALTYPGRMGARESAPTQIRGADSTV